MRASFYPSHLHHDRHRQLSLQHLLQSIKLSLFPNFFPMISSARRTHILPLHCITIQYTSRPFLYSLHQFLSLDLPRQNSFNMTWRPIVVLSSSHDTSIFFATPLAMSHLQTWGQSVELSSFSSNVLVVWYLHLLYYLSLHRFRLVDQSDNTLCAPIPHSFQLHFFFISNRKMCHIPWSHRQRYARIHYIAGGIAKTHTACYTEHPNIIAIRKFSIVYP